MIECVARNPWSREIRGLKDLSIEAYPIHESLAMHTLIRSFRMNNINFNAAAGSANKPPPNEEGDPLRCFYYQV